jgi:hypothetical protein
MAYDASREDRFTRGPDASGPGTARERPRQHERNTSWYWLFVIPFVFLLLPFIYNTKNPELIGIPFFYWYQVAWVPLVAVITLVVYGKTRGA